MLAGLKNELNKRDVEPESKGRASHLAIVRIIPHCHPWLV